jgi:hypothetical protein
MFEWNFISTSTSLTTAPTCSESPLIELENDLDVAK